MIAALEIPAQFDRRENLPGLLSRAGQRLLDARNSAELLEAKQLAEAALHYAKVTKAANDTHADCLRIITRAEMRMANEIDRGQETGEVASQGGDRDSNARSSGNGNEASYADLGISSQRVAEWRETRDAGEAVVEQAIESALADGRAPTKSDIQKHVRGTFGTGDNEWHTPPEYLEAAREVLGEIDLDPASSDIAQRDVKAKQFFTTQENGLTQEWKGRVWLNPPYAQPFIAEFVKKLVDEIAAENVSQAILLTHNYTDTAWFQSAARACSAICFTRGRIRFIDPNGALAAPTQGQAFFYFGKHIQRFIHRFVGIGFVAEVRT